MIACLFAMKIFGHFAMLIYAHEKLKRTLFGVMILRMIKMIILADSTVVLRSHRISLRAKVAHI